MKSNRFCVQGVFFLAFMLGFEWMPLQAQDEAVVTFNKGVEAASKGELDRAIEDYSEAIEINPRYVKAYANRGLTKFQKGDSDGAVADFNQAIRIDPKYADAYYNRGFAKRHEGDFEGAIADYGEAIALNPNDSEAYNNRGNAKIDKGDLDGAISDFNQAIEINPRYVEAYNNRGDAMGQRGDLDRAISDFNKAIEINPRYDGAYYNRGNEKIDKGDLDGAISDFNQAIEINPRNALAYNNRGRAKSDKGDLDGAISDFNQAIKISPRSAMSYFNRGIAEDRQGDHERAVDDYNRAISLKRSQVVRSSPGPFPSPPRSERGVKLGTGFFVTSTGYFLTDFHVVKDASTIRVKTGGGILSATLVAKDATNDLALLKIEGTYSCLPLGDSSTAPLGQTVFTVGFPEPELQGLSPKLTKGEISSLAGMRDDPRMFQISVPVQPGNSGGCLVDESGNVIGLIEASLSTLETAKNSGDLLQNVNYATKINYAKTLLDTVQEAKSGLMPMKTVPAPFKDQVKSVEDATAFIIAGS